MAVCNCYHSLTITALQQFFLFYNHTKISVAKRAGKAASGFYYILMLIAPSARR